MLASESLGQSRVIKCAGSIDEVYAGGSRSMGVTTGSSDALVRDRYAVQKIPTVETKGYRSVSSTPVYCCKADSRSGTESVSP